MTATHTAGTNASSVSIWEASLRRYATDTNEHENTQTPTLSIEVLRAIQDRVRCIKARINGADRHDQDNTATCARLDSVSTADTGPMGGEDPHRAAKEER